MRKITTNPNSKRKKLAKMFGNTLDFTGIYHREDFKNSGKVMITELAAQKSGKEICEHVWSDKKYFDGIDASFGETISFRATVARYTKKDGSMNFKLVDIKDPKKIESENWW